MDVKETRVAVGQLLLSLREITKKDQEQDVMGIAVPILDMVVAAAREHVLPGDPVLERLPELVSSDLSDPWGDSIRAVDALIAVEQLLLALDRAIAATRRPSRYNSSRSPGRSTATREGPAPARDRPP